MKRIYLTLILCFGVLCLQSQNAPYNLEVDNEPYNDLVNPTVITSSQAWMAPNLNIPIGFDFNMFGEDINTFYTSEDIGSVTFLINNPNDQGDQNIVLAGYGSFVVDRGYTGDTGPPDSLIENLNNSQSTISFTHEGQTGSQICKIEWKNLGFLLEILFNETNNDYANAQVWLYESDNSFEVRFGDSSTNSPFTYSPSSDGLTGPIVAASFEDVSEEGGIILSGNPDSPNIVTDFESNITGLNGHPQEGLVLRLTPNNLTSEEFKNLQNISLYPNPAVDYFSLANTANLQIQKVKIFDSAGKKISKIEHNFDKINIQNLNSGLYFIQIETEKGKTVKQLLKK
ncbi:T9SS type A sorting domain-containing protein [Psychroflexus aestuariivivens]|uniref:T9SS type A sorting domain-containing protein n=1 Tax=Psychroflexus aestuariivivens TaxID=1795040 RepID=UPI000FD84AFF|nr:T9SS type A sorting domain-containing protein [Psychroflexus aestuariivivens]